MGRSLQDFFVEKMISPKGNIYWYRVEGAPEEITQPCYLTLDSVKLSILSGHLISFYSLILKHEVTIFTKASNLKDTTC